MALSMLLVIHEREGEVGRGEGRGWEEGSGNGKVCFIGIRGMYAPERVMIPQQSRSRHWRVLSSAAKRHVTHRLPVNFVAFRRDYKFTTT